MIRALFEFGVTLMTLSIRWSNYSIHVAKSLVVEIKYVAVINLTDEYL